LWVPGQVSKEQSNLTSARQPLVVGIMHRKSSRPKNIRRLFFLTGRVVEVSLFP
jgi:hypothetical protein